MYTVLVSNRTKTMSTHFTYIGLEVQKKDLGQSGSILQYNSFYCISLRLNPQKPVQFRLSPLALAEFN